MAKPKFEFEISNDGQVHFRLTVSEFSMLSRGYATRQECEQGINAVRLNAPDGDNYEERKSPDGKPYFILRSSNREALGTSQMFSSSHERHIAILAFMDVAPVAPIAN